MDLNGKRVLLIGGAGLIGSHIVDKLIDTAVSEIIVFDNLVRGTRDNLASALKSPKVKLVEGSMTDRDALDRVVAGVDGVFLLASLWLGECVNDPRSAWEVNTLGTWNVVEALRKHGVKRVVYSSSASVYGNAVVTPMTEDHPFNNRTTYGATKIANEQMFRAMYEQHKLSYVGMRYMNIYGVRMDYEGTYVSVIMRVLDRIFAGERPVIFGDGSQVYDFIYVEDAAAANILAMQADCHDEFFNVGMGIGTSINELVTELLSLTGSPLEPEYRREAQSFVTHRIGSTEKAERLLGFRATTPLREGLRKVVEWRTAQRGIHA
ncbi:MAG TPA: NAD-dependent epimerase/dehydratase family protein [Vicinamibacterales bacterium]|nr:NAD-dependent epimerase/dehydratase family protein [Vicinamibacterales bacterium]